MPQGRTWLQFAEWAKQYGDIIHLSALGTEIVVLSSPKVVSDLLEKRSTIYSDRPTLPMAGELVGYKDALPLCAYGPRYREMRKLLADVISTRSSKVLYPMYLQKVQLFLARIAEDPSALRAHIRWLVGSIVLNISHGRNVKDIDDPLLTLADQATSDFSAATTPGAYFVDVLPILRLVPNWFPGAGFKRKAGEWRQRMKRIRDEEYEVIEQQVKQGTATSSFIANVIENHPERTADQDNIFRWTAVGLYGGGSDTSVSAIESFFLSMSVCPDVQRRAQEELERVVGPNRLPNSGDRPHLPYIEAVIREIYRWNPVAPLSLPHRLTRDDVYKGYHLRAGSIVFANSWAILHDPVIYPDPMDFKPERYLGEQDSGINPDPRAFAFGYGRRACPGERLADDSLFAAVSMTLHLFTISPAKDQNVEPESVDVMYTPEMISHPVHVKCSVKLRSSAVRALLDV
ncbi:hypothetical protein CERSUDRAFT_100592 [Gelatoporia subvermispora B]|uniref:Cytochrome P450 n=1 Tax=Ceriporiopsis subvermispora (strain B) TaxID=914234 RepID=M2QGS6_CERS8|nr:hypothetical protein CERSUDRAFT_100592 [Gelatoporia subvermispora B]